MVGMGKDRRFPRLLKLHRGRRLRKVGSLHSRHRLKMLTGILPGLRAGATRK